MPNETVISNARIVLADEVIYGTLRMENSLITAVDSGSLLSATTFDADGDYLIPGLIDLHTDELERFIEPRNGVLWDALAAVVSHDAVVVTSGVTTVFDALCIGYSVKRPNQARQLEHMLKGLARAGRAGVLRAEHRLHLRCELTDEQMLNLLQPLIDHPLAGFVSVMDHAPGQRQSRDIEKFKHGYLMRDCGLDDTLAALEIDRLLHASEHLAPHNRQGVIALARERSIPLASHDDESARHVEEAARLGITIAEMPVSVEAAEAAHRRGLKVLVGAPNLVRGGSHSGNVAAAELVQRGQVDGFVSDYISSSLLIAAFKLTAKPFELSLPQAIGMVSAAPAQMAGLSDRGCIQSGLRADLVQVRLIDGTPVVRQVWRAGQRL
jgi:alpha-D-ribose 1-methylphosphonate 5-triphosphate diphosphatase